MNYIFPLLYYHQPNKTLNQKAADHFNLDRVPFGLIKHPFATAPFPSQAVFWRAIT
ncbi:hypothetical protein [Paenibacillus taichungensis]|uniref:hypothetical protein n=1 Tax=Paenibacillus taichungensis TaxID=484184 RepID=UPI0015EB540D|nr:hypothetical protein [Paenibacillus taichungensis]